MSGLAAAHAEGRTGGNPALVSGDRTTLSRLRLARRAAFLERLNRSAGDLELLEVDADSIASIAKDG
ncbi:MAG: hypothetical protein F4213_16870 [Boseongicola sp. SB0677_bin_26]|nr:hypothetical protein [Boseongicola sp. SB0665_bin_10]MYG27666.1 hypothetical protein [Boseongicola sp. SB0677_bin_26]